MPLPQPPPAEADLLANVAVVLLRPKHAENIGAAARSAMNMGINRLIVVRDQTPDQQVMLKMATHKAAGIIHAMELHPGLDQALAPFSFVVGTTARLGRKRRYEHTPRDMADTVLPLLANNQVALLFGPEDRGLTNDDLAFCQMTSSIPTADFSSLNLAQAVAIHCYELFGAVVRDKRHGRYTPKLAATAELEGMYAHVEAMLRQIGVLKTEDHTYWMRNIRTFFGRTRLRAKEVRIIRGFCRQLLWFDRQQAEGTKANIEHRMLNDEVKGQRAETEDCKAQGTAGPFPCNRE